ncbi:MAG: hypothetical protein M3345_01660 [Actinomycetota bacterium]|nr:hypothetical protein [Actinomycetota bacterium]
MRLITAGRGRGSAVRVALAIVVALALVLVVRSAAPSSAAGKKKMKGSFVVRALPFPRLDGIPPATQKGSCAAGIGLTPLGVTLEPRARGLLEAKMTGFVGDWDLYVLDPANQVVAGSIQNQLTDQAAAGEYLLVSLDKGQRVQLVGCNWLGSAEAKVDFEFTPQKR